MTPVPTVGDSAKGIKQHHQRPQPVVPGGRITVLHDAKKKWNPLPYLDLGTQVNMMWTSPNQLFLLFFLSQLFLDQSIWFDKPDPSLLLASFPFTSTWFRSQCKHHKSRTRNQSTALVWHTHSPDNWYSWFTLLSAIMDIWELLLNTCFLPNADMCQTSISSGNFLFLNI